LRQIFDSSAPSYFLSSIRQRLSGPSLPIRKHDRIDERESLARIMHKFSTASTKSSALTALHSVGLLNVPYSTFAGASVARLVRSSLSSLRDKNLCIIRAKKGEPCF
jgi:hypothetical protein